MEIAGENMRGFLTFAILVAANLVSYDANACQPTAVKQKIAIFATGPSGVGKTTILKKVAECVTNSVYLNRSSHDSRLQSDFSEHVLKNPKPVLLIRVFAKVS